MLVNEIVTKKDKKSNINQIDEIYPSMLQNLQNPIVQRLKEAYSNNSTYKDLTGHKKRVYTVEWNQSGSKLASGSVDNNIRIWTLGSDKSVEMKGHTESVTHLKFSNNPNEENILISCSSDKTVKLWDIRMGKSIKSEKTKGGCKNLTVNNQGTVFAFSNKDDDQISFYDARKFSLIKQIEFKSKISEFEFDKTDQILVVTSSSGSLYLLDGISLDSEPLAVIEAHFPPVSTLNINKSNTLFATGAADALICIWDLHEMLTSRVIKKGETPIRKVMFSHDSYMLAAIYEGNNLDIFSVNTAECIHTVYTENPQYCIAWNPSAYILAYCGDDKNRNNQDEGNIHLLSIEKLF